MGQSIAYQSNWHEVVMNILSNVLRDVLCLAQTRAEVSRKIRQFGKDGNLAGAIEAFTQMQVRLVYDHQ